MELSEQSISGMLEKIPTFSQSVLRILQLTADIDCSPKDLVAQISHDPILTARVLKLVNSAYFGLSRKVDSIHQSVVYVGINTIKSLAISIAAIGSLPRTNEAGLDMSNFWSHSLETAVVSKLLAQKAGVPRTEVSAFFIGGLLHDIGQIIFSLVQPGEYREVLDEAKQMQRPLHVIEQEVFGLDHGSLGALLAEKWQLPGLMVEAIRHHHDSEQNDSEQVMNRAVFAANEVAKFIAEDDERISMISDMPDAIRSWLGSPFEEIADSLPNLEDEIDSAKVFIQLST